MSTHNMHLCGEIRKISTLFGIEKCILSRAMTGVVQYVLHKHTKEKFFSSDIENTTLNNLLPMYGNPQCLEFPCIY